MILLWAGLALASSVHVVREGETIESIAEAYGTAERAPVIRGDNGLAAGEQPLPGTVLNVPSRPGHQEQEAMVTSISGRAEVTLPGQPATPAARMMRLPAGSLFCTSEDGFATLLLANSGGANHDDVNLQPSTCVRLLSLVSDDSGRSSSIRVESGGVEVRAGDGMTGDVVVITDAGVTTGEAGGFRVALEDAGSARTEAILGAVAVMGGGVEKAVSTGEGSRTVPGEAPSDPVSLLPSGQPISPGEGAVLSRPAFEWTPVEGALGYRLQVSVTPDFSDIVYATESPEAVYVAEYLTLPFRVPGLWWRVSSFDLTGFEGEASAPRRIAIPAGIGP